MDTINIAVAEDNQISLDTLIYLLDNFNGFHIKQIANNGKQLLEQIQVSNHKPDVVLMDIDMPLMNGFETTSELLKIQPDCKVIYLTTHTSETYIDQAIKTQARGYLLKSSSANILHDAICEAIECGYYLNEYFTYDKLVKVLPENENIKQLMPMKTDIKFSQQELLFMSLLYDELNDKDIAQKMNLKASELKKFTNDLMTKIGTQSKVGIIIFAIKHHLIRK